MNEHAHEIIYQRPALYAKQLEAMFDPRRVVAIEASTKAQPLDAMVQTPDGPCRLGDLRLGSKVFAADGSVTRVRAIFPRGRRPVYELKFRDGSTTRACDDHLWLVNESQRGQRLVTTEMLAAMAKNSLSTKCFPLCAPLQYPAKEVPIDPWLLGVLIGDGGLCSNVLTISTADPEIIERAQEALPRGYALASGTKYQWRILPSRRGAGYERRNIRFKADGYEVSLGRGYVGRRSSMAEAVALHSEAMIECYGDAVPDLNLRRALRELGLLGLRHNEKFVPEIYLRNSVHVRQEILRGIMDTDGSAASGNGAIIEQTSARLAEDIIELVRSLGGVARLAVQEPRRDGWKRSYRINIRHNDPSSLFWLPRKAKARPPCRVTVSRKLHSITRIADDEVACINIAHPSGLYLTDDHIVTHNSGKTVSGIIWLYEQAMMGRPGDNYWWVAPVSMQSRIAFNRMQRHFTAAETGQSLFTVNRSDHTLTTLKGTIIAFRSGDHSDTLYGEDVHAAVIDEASRFKEGSWHAIRSTLTATRGPIRIIGNVKGRKNWFFQLARRAEQGEPDLGYHKLTADDAVAAGVIDKEEIVSARSMLPEHVFRELYYAEPSDDEGNPFGSAHIRACFAPLSGRPAVAWGWDLARKQDWTVGIGLDADGRVCEALRFQRPWHETVDIIKKFVGNTPALVDETGVGDPIVEAVKLPIKRGSNGAEIIELSCPRLEGFRFTSASKQQLMEGLALAIHEQKVRFPEGPISIELLNFEYSFTRLGIRYEAAPGFHDDAVCALALAWRCFDNKSLNYAQNMDWIGAD